MVTLTLHLDINIQSLDVGKEGQLHPGECVSLFPPVFKEVKGNCEELVQSELVGT